ncbi:MAG: hypothetical protein ACK53Y_09115 [bacterium]
MIEVLLYRPSEPEWRKTKLMMSGLSAEQPTTKAEHSYKRLSGTREVST